METIEGLIKSRKEQKIPQEIMADALKITRATLSKYESGKRKMPLVIAEGYARELGGRIMFVSVSILETFNLK